MVTEPDYKFATSLIIEALTEARGNLTEAAKFIARRTGETCSRQYVKDACDKRPALLAFVDDLRQEVVDKAESNIFGAVFEGDVRMSVLVAERLGKDRGWVKKEEIEVSDPNQSVERLHAARERARAARKMAAQDGSIPAEPVEPGSDFEERFAAKNNPEVRLEEAPKPPQEAEKASTRRLREAAAAQAALDEEKRLKGLPKDG